MWNMITLQTLGVMIVCSGAALVLSRKGHIPHIVLYILTGLILGRMEFAALDEEALKQTQSAVEVISETGIALLLFLVGMELSLSKIKDVGKVAVVAGLGQVVFTAIFGMGIGLALGYTMVESLVLGSALTFSSTVVVVKLLGEKRHINKLYGRISIGIFLVQDLVVIAALTILAGISDQGDAQTWDGVWWDLGKAFLGMGALLFLTLAVAKIFLRRLMNWGSSSADALVIWSLSWCFLILYAAHAFNLSKEIGAFLAGVSLAQLPLSNTLKQRIHPLMNFFIGVFFISLGMGMDLGLAFENIGPSLIFSLFVLVGNPLIFMIIILKGGYSEKTSFLAGVTVAQISEFSFIFAAMCHQKGLIGKEPLTIIAFVGLITIITSSYMIMRNEQLYAFFKKRSLLKIFGGKDFEDEDLAQKEVLKGHIVVFGMNSLGREVCLRLHQSKRVVLAVDSDPQRLEGLPCQTLVGNAEYASVLEEASVESASLVVTTIRIEDVNNFLVYKCGQLGTPVAAHGFDSAVIPGLKNLGADYIMDSRSSWLKKLFDHMSAEGAR